MSAATPDPRGDDREQEIDRLGPWFHNLHLPGGVQTAPDHPLGDFPIVKWRQFADSIPADLTGWTALDIGCNAGFYSFELARRGAEVTALDHDEHYLAQARWAADQYDLADRITFRRAAVCELGRSRRQWDLVLFMGVLYHLRYPLLALDLLATRVRRLMIFQTLTAPGEQVLQDPGTLGILDRGLLACRGWPTMAFLEREFERDPTNWWAPNHACALAMLRSCGFAVESRPAPETYVCRPGAHAPETAQLEELLSALGGEHGS